MARAKKHGRKGKGNASKKKTCHEDKKKLENALVSDMEGGLHEEERMQALLYTISSQSFDEDIIYSLATISGFVEKEKGMYLLVKLNGMNVISPCLLHSNIDVREKVIGVIRNFLIAGNDCAIETIFHNNVIGNLMILFSQANSLLNMESNVVSREKLQKELLLLLQCFQLFTLFCETSAAMVESLDVEFLLHFFLSVITNDQLDIPLRCAAATSLYTLSEENGILISLVTSQPTLIQGLPDIIVQSPPDMMLGILSCGIMLNVSSALTSAHIKELQNSTVKLVALCLDISLTTFSDTSKHEEVKDILNTQDLALELLTNMLCHPDENCVWEEMNDSIEASDQDELVNEKQIRLLQILIDHNIPKMIVQNCQSYSSVADLADVQITKSFNKMKARSWHCISNLVSTSPVELLGGVEHIELLWTILGESLFTEEGELRDRTADWLDAAASAFRSIIEKLTRFFPHKVCTLESVSMVSKMIVSGILASTKLSLSSALGMIGQHASRDKGAINVLMEVGKMLTYLLNKNIDLLVLAEVIDAAIDSFADGPHVDTVLQATDLMRGLKTLSTTMKSQIKSSRKSLGENYEVVNMACVNLQRFIQYKEKR